MILEKRSHYKSWGQLKKQMLGLLCEALRDKITYTYTSYHRGPFDTSLYGRASIVYDKKELLAFTWNNGSAQWDDIIKTDKEKGYNLKSLGSIAAMMEKQNEVEADLLQEKWMPEGMLSEVDFIDSVTLYLKTDIETSLHSDNYLLRVFAYLDRRVGKRTLIKIRDEAEKLPEWVKQFYQIRCQAEGMNLY